MNLQDRLARLTPEQKKLLARRLQRGGSSEASSQDIPLLSRDTDRFPLSSAQERLWFEHKLDPTGVHYNESVVLHVKGPLRLDLVEQALARIVRGSDILRTGFSEQGGAAAQIVAREVPIVIRLDDLTGTTDETARRQELHRRIREEIRRPFIMDRPPLFRMTAFRIGAEEHMIVFVVHHIVLDGWAAAGIFRELFAHYDAQLEARSEASAGLPLQYGDYAHWERQRLADGKLNDQLEYWMSQLPEALVPTVPPLDRPRSSTPSTRGARVAFRCDAGLRESLQELSRRNDTTLFVTLAAAYGLLLSRLGDTGEVLLAVPSTTRDRPELESMLGLFINTLLLRIPVDARQNFRSYLATVHRLMTEARDNHLYPFDRIVEHLRRRQDLGPVPLTSVMFDMQRLPTNIAPRDLSVTYFDIDVGTSKFELGLSIRDMGDELTGVFEYSTDLFDAATVEAFARQFQTLLRSIVAEPDSALSDLSALSDEERQVLIADVNRTGLPFPERQTLHGLLDTQAALTPSREAVACGSETLSFQHLVDNANRLARHLRAYGVVRGTPVVLMMERSTDLIVGLFGILKAGGVYVPVDPLWPAARVAAVLDDLGQDAFVLTHREVALPEGARVLRMDAARDALMAQPATPLSDTAEADDLAYILYTSGSTGQPKGVMVAHRSIANLFAGLKAAIYAPLGEEPLRVALNGSIAFDTSVKQIIQLAAGHTLDIVPEEIRADSSAFVTFLAERQIDVLDCTPSQLGMLTSVGLLEPNRGMPRCLLVGGEAIDQALWTRLSEARHVCIVNLYGPTECTVDATWAQVGTSVVPVIGRPLANVRVYVLDPKGRPVPTGHPGELFIGGEGVSRGYLGDAELTARRFVPDLFTKAAGARLYRTGDRVRFRSDGTLAFINRVDDQIKLRGYRIEPGEIRAVLKAQDGVRDAAVVAKGEGDQKRLVAYVVPERRRAPVVDGQVRYKLPNGLAVVDLNRNETDFLYEEMFVVDAYLRNGITLKDGDVVFDVGANIGLFSLSAHLAARDVTIHAFEPNPTVFSKLKTNTELYGVKAYLHCKALAAEKSARPFTFYRKFSFLSGLHANQEDDMEVVRSFVRKHDDTGGTSYDAALLEELLEERLSGETINVEIDTLSEVIAAGGVERIDLLKINVEKSEAEVLAGIQPADWAKIRQVALEVHDIDGRLEAVRRLLVEQGFTVFVEQDWRLEKSTRTNFYVYARRGETPTASSAPSRRIPEPVLDADLLRDALRHQLPSHMVPATIMFLDKLPLTPSGKLDTRALPKIIAEPVKRGIILPRTETEQLLTAIWCKLLDRREIGVDEDFFRLGGHSLLATSLVAQVNETFSVSLPLRTLFQSPTVAQLAQQIELAAASEAVSPDSLSENRIIPDPASWSEPFGLTDIQEAYWMGRSAVYELGNAATQIYLELEQTEWDVSRIEAAWNVLIRRHDMLRAVILSENHQRVMPEVPYYPIAVHDLSVAGPEAISAHLDAVRSQMTQQMMRADQWPLFDVRATKLPDGVVRLHISIDALIADAASLFQLFSEWDAAYATGRDTRPPLSVGFRDYVLAENRLHEGDLYHKSEKYWLGRLDTLPPAPDLPLARSPASLARPRFVRRSRRLSPATWASLKRRAADAGLTPSIILIAAFAEVLANWSASAHFTLNLTTFNRLPLHPDVAGLIGDFTTLTLLEVDCTQPESFKERARHLQERLWDDLEHRHMSGVSVLRALAQRRRSGGSVLMPVVFTSALDIDTAGANARRFGEVVHSVSQTPQVWLDHQVMEWNGSLVLNWDAVEDLFPPGLLDDLAAAHGNLLERLANSDASWNTWEGGLIPARQLAVRAAVNATQTPIPSRRLEDGFLEQASRTPDAIAVISGDTQLTYADLRQRSIALAHWLREKGCFPGQPVAIAMRKGWEQVAGVLGILFAGGAYVPVDPDLPGERIRYILDHCDIRLALTQSHVDLALDWPEGIERICVDRSEAAACDLDILAGRGGPEKLAYILFTSGSTGVPKGVMIAHDAINNSISDFNARYGVVSEDRVLALSALSFDLSVFDIFGLLAAGGGIVIPDPDRLRDPSHWVKLAVRHRVTIWNSVPILMQMMVEAVEPQPDLWPTSLRLVLMSGDWIPVNLPDRMRALGPDLSIHSQGGATETSINAFTFEINEVDPDWKSIPYGTPLANQTGNILNAHLEPAPDWVPGELYVGGRGLALGYWKDEAKTDAAFIHHPRTGERLYRTGDYGRYWPDGTLEFLGRRDTQVKIRGHRVELGEIEAVLCQHPDVEAAVVTAPVEPDGSRRLVAYVVCRAVPADEVASGVSADGVLLDPMDRLAFKLGRKGLRRFGADETAVKLPGNAFDDERRRSYLHRQSFRRFSAGAVSLESLGNWIRALQECGIDGSPMPKFRYPSAGSLYPVQLYLVIKNNRVSGLDAGSYYYDPVEHRLIRVGETSDITAFYPRPNHPLVEAGAFSVLCVADIDAIKPMYGDLTRDFCLLEAGYMGQLLMETAPEAGLGLCPLGFVADEPVRAALGLGANHVILHTFAAGAIDPVQLDRWLPEEPTAPLLQDDLRSWLQRKLPAHMLPSTFMVLDELPLNANGKVDRRALPAPAAITEIVPPVGAAAPQSDVEWTILDAVSAVLQRSTDSAESNFFDLGANSIHLVQIHRRVQEALNIKFPLIEIFQNPSVRRLANWLGSNGQAELATDEIQERANRARAERRKRASRRGSSAAASDETGHGS